MNKLTTLAAGVTLAVASIGAFAQATATPRVDQREANQQARIDAGVASGQLTAREANRLDKQQAQSPRRGAGQGRRHRHARRAPPARSHAEPRQREHPRAEARRAGRAEAVAASLSGRGRRSGGAAPLSASARA